MRSAYPGTQGYHAHSAPFDSGNSGYDQGADRLSNIRRTIDSIEQRLMGAAAPVVGYGQPAINPMLPGPMPTTAPHMPMQFQPHYQPQYGHPMGYPATGRAYYPAQAPMHPMDNIGAEISRRQQMLNATATNGESVSSAAAAGNAGIGRHLEELKKELAAVRAQVSKPVAVQQSVPQQEIDRIAKAISDIQSGEDANDATFDRLTKELNQLRSGMRGDVRSALQKGLEASGESQIEGLSKRLDQLGKDVRSAIRSELKGSSKDQTSDLVRRFEELNQGLDQISVQSANAVAPRVDSLSAQLDSLRMTIDDLPQTLAISRIDERLGELADKVNDLNNQVSTPQEEPDSTRVTPEEFVSIEKRLDEIARALVAVSNTGRNAPKIDMSAVERVEARMSELARTLDGLAEQGDGENLNKLSVRIEGLTERLASFEKYAESGDLGAASALFASPDTGVIEDQLRALNSRIDEVASQPGTGSLEQQIQQLSQQVEETSAHHSTSEQLTSLEGQIGQILQQMDGMGGVPDVDFAPVEARLGQIEHQLQSNQNFSLEAAQQAAQHAVSMMGPQSETGSVIEALAHDLKSLQLIAEGNAVHSNQSVEQVQQTLQQVVDRLAAIEGALEEDTVRQATLISSDSVPASGLAMPVAGTLPDQSPLGQSDIADIGPEQVISDSSDGLVDAAIADENLGIANQATLDVGLVHPHATHIDAGDSTDDSLTAPSAPENLPLEPGSAAPDIDAMVEKAKAQLSEAHSKMAAGAAKSEDGIQVQDDRSSGDLRPDAVAAARRALQATTAEMAAVRDEVDEKKDKSKSSKLSLLNSAKNFDSAKLRKPLVLGAAALLLAIVTFKGIGLFTGSDSRPVAKLDAPAVEMNGDTKKNDVAAVDNSKDSPANPASKKTVRTVGKSAETVAEIAPVPKVQPSSSEKAQTALAENSVTPPQVVNVPLVAAEPEAIARSEAPSVAESVVKDEPKTASQQEQPVVSKTVYEVSPSAGPVALVAAASSGDPKALFQLGMRYSDGNSVKRNMTESAKWFQRSADAGFAPAQYSLGSLYEKGIGVERDIAKATDWYEKAAVQGNARAMHNLAVIYAMGNPPAVQPNMDTAVEWFKKAAQFGIKDSQFNLGILYGQGMGVPQNLVDSYKWFALAAKTGDGDANKKRDEVANAMDPDDLDYARKEVNNWAPSKLNEAVNRVAVPEEWRGRATSGRSVERTAPQNASVMKAQDMLNQRGFNVGDPDGLIGPKTKRAIMEFQKDAGIPITGKVDDKLLQALEL